MLMNIPNCEKKKAAKEEDMEVKKKSEGKKQITWHQHKIGRTEPRKNKEDEEKKSYLPTN
jgi:hypothetical protein